LDRVYTIHVDVHPRVHLKRLLSDKKFQNRPNIAQYFEYWHSIQVIREHLNTINSTADLILDGRHTVEHQIATIAQHFYAWKQSPREHRTMKDTFRLANVLPAAKGEDQLREKFLSYLRSS